MADSLNDLNSSDGPDEIPSEGPKLIMPSDIGSIPSSQKRGAVPIHARFQEIKHSIQELIQQTMYENENKELQYEMVDFHSQRPGHDLRYALSGEKMKTMGWAPHSAFDRLESTIQWTLENDRWLAI